MPNVTLVSTRSTSVTLKLSQAERDEVHTYMIVLTYLGPCRRGNSFSANKSSSMEEFMIITSLEEYSNYSISVIAINGAGPSSPANTSIVTLSSGKY